MKTAIKWLGCAALLWLPLSVLLPAGPARSETPVNRPIEERYGGYISSGACRSCHPREYASWHASYHRTMTQVATPTSVLGNFDDAQVELDGVSYRLYRKGDEYFADWENVSRLGKRKSKHVQIVLTTGSHHDQMYWYTIQKGGRALRQLPLDWSLRLGRWISTKSTYLTPPQKIMGHGQGEWNRVCSKCHSVGPQLRADSETQLMDTRVAEFGIACEACHGPSETHADENRNPVRRYAQHLGTEVKSTVVNPGKIDSKRSAEICGQCHGVWLMGDELDAYRPGMEIHLLRTFVRPVYLRADYQPINEVEREQVKVVRDAVRGSRGFYEGSYWSDGVIRVSGREYSGLRESACFERGELTCTTCHQMHQAETDERPIAEWTNDQLAVGMRGNAACVECHAAFGGDDISAHTRHVPESTGSLCYNCHMPFTVYGVQKAHRNHTVASPSADETVNTGRPNACNQCHLDRTLTWAAERLQDWYGLPAPAITGDYARVAAGALWALRGDAGQRALTAQSMGWDAARDASGARSDDDWMIPYLAQLLDDPYDSVRFIAEGALRKRTRFADFEYDFVGPRSKRRAAVKRARGSGRFVHVSPAETRKSAVLLDEAGNLAIDRFKELLSQRDDRVIDIRE